MSFSTASITYWAMVNTADGTVTGTGQTSADSPNVPVGAVVVSADNHATIVAAEVDGLQCKLISGVVRLMQRIVPAPLDLTAIKTSAYVVIDSLAEEARASFLTLGSGQILEYQQTASDAQRLVTLLRLSPAPVSGTISVRTVRPRAGTANIFIVPGTSRTVPAIVFDPDDYPFLVAEQAALASIGISVGLDRVALSILATMQQWNEAGAAIKSIRRQTKLQVSVATTATAISALLSALSYPQAGNLATPGMIPGT